MFKILLGFICLTSALASRYGGFGNKYDDPSPSAFNFPYYDRPMESEEPEYFGRGSRKVFPEQPKTSPPSVPTTVIKSVEPEETGIVSIVSSCALTMAKSALKMIVKVPAIIVGSVIAFGICKLTPICGQIKDMDLLLQAKREIVSYATPERIARASDLVDKVVRKYRSITK